MRSLLLSFGEVFLTPLGCFFALVVICWRFFLSLAISFSSICGELAFCGVFSGYKFFRMSSTFCGGGAELLPDFWTDL